MMLTIQIFIDFQWVDAATVHVNDVSRGGVRSGSVFAYEPLYAMGSYHPVSLNFPVTMMEDILTTWPAFLYDLIPQGNGRKYLLGELEMKDGESADFSLLKAGAFNPIGRLRIKESVDFYHAYVDQHDTDQLQHGLKKDELLLNNPDFVERMHVHGMLASGTTGVQGAAPKFLLTQDDNGLWFADGQLQDAQARKHYIVKLPRGKTEADHKVLRNESAYMRVAKEMGLNATEGIEFDRGMLFIPRFDRNVIDGRRVRYHQESLASVAGIAGYEYRPSQFELLDALRKVATRRQRETIEFMKRDVLNLAMKNTDNHARNTAVQIRDGNIVLTPLFDFAPMYMDPEGIPRAARWNHPETKKEIHEWSEIIAVLETNEKVSERLSAQEKDLVRSELYEFGKKMESLEEIMRACHVEQDIIEFLRPAIKNQTNQLLALH